MEKETREIIKTSEAAKLLGVNVGSIHRYVKEGKLKPVYDEKWQIDTSKLFYEDEVLNFKEQLIKPGITTGDAAKLLGLHIKTINSYIQKGTIFAEKKPYKGRELYFISPEEIERVKSELTLQKRSDQKNFFDRDKGFSWFQSFQNESTGEFGRILVNDEQEPYLLTNQNRHIPYEDIKKSGFGVIYNLEDHPYIHKKGYALFLFPYEKTLGSPVFKLMDFLYKTAGPRNMKVNLRNNNEIQVEVKPVLLPLQEEPFLMDILKNSLQKGELYIRYNGVYIDSEIESITFSIPAELKEKIKEDAEKLKVTMEEYVLMIVQDKYLKERSMDDESTHHV